MLRRELEDTDNGEICCLLKERIEWMRGIKGNIGRSRIVKERVITVCIESS